MSSKPMLLICDGHGSHVNSEIVELAHTNNIHILCLPPHTTHKLQPLDVGVFGPMQRAWSKRCEQYSVITGDGMRRQDVVKEYMAARSDAFKESTILQAWRKAGIKPLNPNIFTSRDYAPSTLTSVSDQLPPSVPDQLPAEYLPPNWDVPSSDDPDFDPEAPAPPDDDEQIQMDSDSGELHWSENDSDEDGSDFDGTMDEPDTVGHSFFEI